MKVQELIDALQLCNPDMDVMCESDSMANGGWPAGGVSFRSCAPTEFADCFTVGFGLPNRCVLITLNPDTDPDED